MGTADRSDPQADQRPATLDYASPTTQSETGNVHQDAKLPATLFLLTCLIILSVRLYFGRIGWPIAVLLGMLFFAPPVLTWWATRRRPIRVVRVVAFVLCTWVAGTMAVHRAGVLANDPNFPRSRWRGELLWPAAWILVPVAVYGLVALWTKADDQAREK